MRKLLVLGLGLAMLWGALRALRGPDAAAQEEAANAKLLFDRLWLDREPPRRASRDTMNALFVLDGERERDGRQQPPAGLFWSGSPFKAGYELFLYAKRGNPLPVRYPQTDEREALRYKATRCRDKGFHYCLEIEGASRGVRRYYSREGWEMHDLAAARARVAAFGPEGAAFTDAAL